MAEAAGLHSRALLLGEGPADAILRMTGRPMADDLLAQVGRIGAEPWFRPGMRLLIDYSEVERGAGLLAPEARGLAELLVEARARSLPGTLIALVSDDPATFGSMRMTLSYEEIAAAADPAAAGHPVRAFTTAEAAFAWLATRVPPERP